MKKSPWILSFVMILLFPLQVVSEPFQEVQVVGSEKIAEILETHLQRVIHDGGKRIEVKEVRCYEKIILPAGTFSYEVTMPDQAYRGGNVTVTVLFRVNGKEVKKVRIGARVDIYADVVVAGHYLKRHDVIQQRDIQWANRNISSLPPDIVTESEEVTGKRTTLSVNGGEVLRRTMVERTPLVKKGDCVMMCVENDQFKITTLGEVQEEGGRGERIKIVNLSSRKEAYGRVLDSNTVQIDF